MDLTLYLTNLKEKFNYNDKLLVALSKVLKAMITYYGEQYQETILEAISKTEIICCSEEETISIVINKKNLIKEDRTSSIIRENKAIASGTYISEPTVNYDELLKTYVIHGINRYIILSHTYNLDSARGLAALTKELINLIKSYKDEYRIENNRIIKRTGLLEEIKEISNSNELKLDLIKETNAALEEGLTIYDEEQIVSIILNDRYEDFSYKLPKEVAIVLNEKLGLKNDIVSSSIDKTKALEVEFNKKPNMFNTLSNLTDKAAMLENEKEDNLGFKDKIEELNIEIKNTVDELSNVCITYYQENINEEEKIKA